MEGNAFRRSIVWLAAIGLLLVAASMPSGQLRAQVPGKAAFLLDPTTAQFTTLPVFPECVQLSVQRGDPSSGPAVILVKAPAGCTIPWHWHSFTEEVMMVSGQARLQMKGQEPVVLEAGGYAYLPGRHTHRFTAINPCMFYLALEGAFDIYYVDKEGKVIPVEEALGKAAPATPKN